MIRSNQLVDFASAFAGGGVPGTHGGVMGTYTLSLVSPGRSVPGVPGTHALSFVNPGRSVPATRACSESKFAQIGKASP